jgi:hypothetical protein
MKSRMKAACLWLCDFSHGVAIIELILTFAILGLIYVEVRAGNQQLAIGSEQLTMLKSLNNDVAAQARVLNDLTRTDKNLLSSMDQANKEFQSSLAISKEASAAMQSQLAILEAEQKARLAEAAKKPQILASIGDFTIGGRPRTPIKARRITPTEAILDLTVTNTGTASLANGELTVAIEAPDVSLSCSGGCVAIPIPQPADDSSRRRSFDLPLGRRIGPDISILITMTLQFPKGHLPFAVFFSVDGDNYRMTRLGSIIVGPARD